MVNFKCRFVFLVFCFLVLSSISGASEREVSFSWEPMPGATAYEVEILNSKGKVYKRIRFLNPEFTFRVGAGKYKLRARSIDQRGVSGQWSEGEDVAIPPAKVPSVQILAKKPSVDPETQTAQIPIRISPMTGIDFYKVVILDEQGKVELEKTSQQTSLTLELGAGHYKVEITASKDDLESDQKLFSEIHIQGSRSDTVIIGKLERVDGDYKVGWSSGRPNTFYNVMIERRDMDSDESSEDSWDEIYAVDGQSPTQVVWPSNGRPGVFRVTVRAQTKGWLLSKPTDKTFFAKPTWSEIEDAGRVAESAVDFRSLSK
jgi:hypothetical protein